MIKETGILIDSHIEETTNMDEKNESTEEFSIKCPVTGCNFGGFAKVYDKYQTVLTESMITSN